MPWRRVLYLTKHHVIKAYGVVDLYLHTVLTPTLDGASPSGGASDTYCVGSWVSPRATLDGVAKRKIFFRCRKSNTGRPSLCLVIILTEVSRLCCKYRLWISMVSFSYFTANMQYVRILLLFSAGWRWQEHTADRSCFVKWSGRKICLLSSVRK